MGSVHDCAAQASVRVRAVHRVLAHHQLHQSNFGVKFATNKCCAAHVVVKVGSKTVRVAARDQLSKNMIFRFCAHLRCAGDGQGGVHDHAGCAT